MYDDQTVSGFISLINVANEDDDRPITCLAVTYLMRESCRTRQNNGEDSVYESVGSPVKSVRRDGRRRRSRGRRDLAPLATRLNIGK